MAKESVKPMFPDPLFHVNFTRVLKKQFTVARNIDFNKIFHYTAMTLKKKYLKYNISWNIIHTNAW